MYGVNLISYTFRFAKKKLDDYSFFGGVLHLCYAPEYETIVDTREKLQERRRIIASKLKRNGKSLLSETSFLFKVTIVCP